MRIAELMQRYLEYVGRSEAPIEYHRWSFVVCCSVALGRRVWFPMGHTNVYPNLYVILVGDPGTRKNTAMNIAKNLLSDAGYTKYAGSTGSRERLYMDLEDAAEMDLYSISQQFIYVPELSHFMGEKNTGLITALTSLYDPDPFDARYKNSKSSKIENPCLSLFGGCTHQSFAESFPPAIMHNGFLSRLILVYGGVTGIKLHAPPAPNIEEKQFFIDLFSSLRENDYRGQLGITPEANRALKEIYEQWGDLDDGRFSSYTQRRYTHLLKLITTVSASVGKLLIEYSDVVYANTLLDSAEQDFHKALGEFGKAKNADESTVVMNTIRAAKQPLSMGQIWKTVNTSLARYEDMRQILSNLASAGKITHQDSCFIAVEMPRRSVPHTDRKLLQSV